jgi:hypothetical protein
VPELAVSGCKIRRTYNKESPDDSSIHTHPRAHPRRRARRLHRGSLLARDGIEVTLIEREVFPRYHIEVATTRELSSANQ